jgi:gas vesicle protein
VRQFSDDTNDYGSSTGAFFTGLFAGAVIGAGLGLWFAPKTGEEMRGQITDTARDMGQRVSKTVTDLADRGREVFDKAREVMNTAGDQINQVASDASKTAASAANAARRGPQNMTTAGERS